MGLLLSVLVVCVGVLEVLACVRHFQDGYLPLWTPHCAVTSRYTATYERWRKEPSDGYEFRPIDDVNDAFNRSENHLLQTSSNVQNGSAGKQIEKTGENNCPSTYQQSKSDSGNGFSPSISGCKTEVTCCGNKPDIMASSLDCDEGVAGVVASSGTDVVPDIPHAEYGKKSQDAFTAERTCGLQSEKHPVSISAQYGVLISRTEAESPAPSQPNSILEGTVSHDTGIDKRPVSTKYIDIHNEVSVVYTGSELHTSPWESATDRHLEGDSSDDILSGKYLTRHTFGTEPELEIPSSDLCSNKVSDTKSTVGQPDGQVPSPEGKPNIPLSDFTTNTCSSTVSEVDQIPATEIESQIPSPDFTIEKSLSTTGEHENQASSIRNETNILSSCLQMQDDKSVFGVTAWDPPDTIQETLDKHEDALSQDECTIPTSLNSEQRHQNSFVPNSVSEETSIATVESCTPHGVSLTQDAVEPERTGIVSEKPFSSPESHADRKELPASSIHVECEKFLSAESGEQLTGTDINEGIEALNSQAEISVSAHNAGNATDIHLGFERLKQEDVQFVTVGEHPVPETSVDVEEDRTGAQHDVLESLIRREASSPHLQNEKQINVASDDARQDVSESRLDSQTTVTDSVSSRYDSTPYEDDSGFPGSGSLTKPPLESFDLRTSSITSVTPLTVDISVQSSLSPSPLTIDTSFETSASVTPLPTDHQPSLSPPKLPSTPRKSKADISWPTFFPGAPVIKRPSVTFATPESVFTNEDEELLRQFVQEASTGSSRIKIQNDTSTATESESTTASTSEGELSGSPGTPERSDSLEVLPVVYREKSPSGIVSGNDFSRKELKLQRRKSYKQKRYSSAIEIRAQDEETEDRSFGENHPEFTRASSVKEPKKRYKKLAKSSSFEDAVLRDIKPEGERESCLTDTTGGITDVSILEVRETGSEETQQDEQEDFGGFAGETEGSIDITDSQTIRTERNEPKLNESK
jgi:hypothetical protein